MENPQNRYMEVFFCWENHLFLWAIYTMAMLNNQRVYGKEMEIYGQFLWMKKIYKCLHVWKIIPKLLKTVKRDKRDLRLSYTQNIEIKSPGIACCPFHFCIEFSQVPKDPDTQLLQKSQGQQDQVQEQEASPLLKWLCRLNKMGYTLCPKK